MRLTPESLGQIKIHLKIEEAHVWATFQPSSDASHDAIDQTLASLRATLESRGLIVERLEVLPSGLANFDQTLRDSNHQSNSPGAPGPSQQNDPNAAGSQSGQSGSGQSPGNRSSASTAAPMNDQNSSSDTELIPDPIGPASLFMEDSLSEFGMARRLRLDAMA